ERVSGGSVSPVWTADGEALTFTRTTPAGATLLRVDLATGETTSLQDEGASGDPRVDIGHKLINRAESKAERMRPGTWLRGVFGCSYLAEAKGEVPEQRSPDGEWFASIRDDNVALRSSRDGRHQ